VLTLASGASIVGNSTDADVYLASGAHLALTASLASMTGVINVTSENTASGTLIASCSTTIAALQSASKIIANGVAASASGSNILIR
jgi:hypothetical protein